MKFSVFLLRTISLGFVSLFALTGCDTSVLEGKTVKAFLELSPEPICQQWSDLDTKACSESNARCDACFAAGCCHYSQPHGGVTTSCSQQSRTAVCKDTNCASWRTKHKIHCNVNPPSYQYQLIIDNQISSDRGLRTSTVAATTSCATGKLPEQTSQKTTVCLGDDTVITHNTTNNYKVLTTTSNKLDQNKSWIFTLGASTGCGELSGTTYAHINSGTGIACVETTCTIPAQSVNFTGMSSKATNTILFNCTQ